MRESLRNHLQLYRFRRCVQRICGNHSRMSAAQAEAHPVKLEDLSSVMVEYPKKK